MKNILTLITVIGLLSSVYGNEHADQCEQIKGNWQWNGSVNEWQCLDVRNNVIVMTTVDSQEQNQIATEPTVEVEKQSSWSKHSLGEKAIIVAGAPIVAAGFVVAAVVVAPVYIVKKIFE